MPHYRFTYLAALFILLGYGLALLWPDDAAQVWGWHAMVCLPLLLAIFAWSAVRGAAPLDDRAFHRTLPPGDGVAFRKVAGSMALVPAGIALVVLIYCWKSGFGWRAQTWGLAVLTVPVIGVLSAFGLTASLATSRSYRRMWPWLWLLGTPVFSAAVMAILIDGLDPDVHRTVYFTHWRTIVLTGAVLYPLIWWLIAARRRVIWGVALATALGMLWPWLYHYGDLGPDLGDRSQNGLETRLQLPSQAQWLRKPLPPGDGGDDKGLDVSQIMDIKGMEDGEVYLFSTVRLGADAHDPDRKYLRNWEIIQKPGARQEWRSVALTASKGVDGHAIFGRNVIWSTLSKGLPGSYPIQHWSESWGMNQSLNHPPRTVVLRPGAELGPGEQEWSGSGFRRSVVKGNPEADMNDKPWSIVAMRYRFDVPVMHFPVAKGGSKRLPEGGLAKIHPLKTEGGKSSIAIDLIREDLWQSDGPWPGSEVSTTPLDFPWCFLVDREMGRSYIMDGLNWGSERQVMLGNRVQLTFDAGSADSPDMTEKLRRLPLCEIYLLWPRFVGAIDQPIEEAPVGNIR